MGGRPTKLTARVKAKLLRALAAGGTYKLAAAHARITERTLYGWLARGEAHPDSEYGRFFQDVNGASADAAVGWLETMDTDDKGWQRFAWKLERRYQSEYALQKDTVPVAPAITTVQVIAPALPPDLPPETAAMLALPPPGVQGANGQAVADDPHYADL